MTPRRGLLLFSMLVLHPLLLMPLLLLLAWLLLPVFRFLGPPLSIPLAALALGSVIVALLHQAVFRSILLFALWLGAREDRGLAPLAAVAAPVEVLPVVLSLAAVPALLVFAFTQLPGRPWSSLAVLLYVAWVALSFAREGGKGLRRFRERKLSGEAAAGEQPAADAAP